MVQKDLNGHLDRVNLLIQLTHGQGHLNEWTLSELFLRIHGSPIADVLLPIPIDRASSSKKPLLTTITLDQPRFSSLH